MNQSIFLMLEVFFFEQVKNLNYLNSLFDLVFCLFFYKCFLVMFMKNNTKSDWKRSRNSSKVSLWNEKYSQKFIFSCLEVRMFGNDERASFDPEKHRKLDRVESRRVIHENFFFLLCFRCFLDYLGLHGSPVVCVLCIDGLAMALEFLKEYSNICCHSCPSRLL